MTKTHLRSKTTIMSFKYLFITVLLISVLIVVLGQHKDGDYVAPADPNLFLYSLQLVKEKKCLITQFYSKHFLNRNNLSSNNKNPRIHGEITINYFLTQIIIGTLVGCVTLSPVFKFYIKDRSECYFCSGNKLLLSFFPFR